MTLPRSLVLAVLVLSSLSAAATTISGTVSPGGMTVAAYDSGGALAATTTAAAGGNYSLTVAAGYYRVLAWDPTGIHATSFYDGAESFETSLLLDVRTNVSGINLVLVPAGYVAGTVTASSAPQPNITVAAYNTSGTRRGFTKTAANGTYRLVVPPGTYKLAAYDEAGNLATSFHDGRMTFGDATPLSVNAGVTTTVDFALTVAGRIRGTARDAASAATLPNIRVAAYGADGSVIGTAATSSAGAYELVLPAGSYRLVFSDAAAGVYATVFWPGAESFDTSAAVGVTSGAIANADAVLAIGGRIGGVARDAATGATLSNISIAAFNASGTIRSEVLTDGAGGYSLLVPPGTYRIGAFDRALVRATMFHPQQPLFASATPLTVASTQSIGTIDFALTRGAKVSGTVRDPLSAAVPGIIVDAWDSAGVLVASAASAQNGTYALVVPPGVYRLAAFDPALRYVSANHGSVALAAGQSFVADFTVSLGGAVTGTVRAAATAQPLQGIMVSAYDSAGTAVLTAPTDSAGRFALVIPAGSYRFAAYDPQRRYATSFHSAASTFELAQVVTIPTGHNATIDFSLAAAAPAARRRAVRK